jgi:hypothetical protein
MLWTVILKEVGLKLWKVVCENVLAVTLLKGGFLKAFGSDVDMRVL